MKLEIYSKTHESVGATEVSEEIFGAEVRKYLFWEVINWQRAKRRSGTHKTKGRSEVSGGGKKPFRQKGTGRARQGSTRAPHWVGGGTVFGPQPRDYSYSMPKKKRRAALISALSFKAENKQIFVVEDLKYDGPKTKQVVGLMDAFSVKSALFVDATTLDDAGVVQHNDAFRLSVRNIPSAKYLAVEGLNVEDIIAHTHLFFTVEALKLIQEKLKHE